ncbi:contractile injection system tape measure protein [Chryseobacterium oryctis]|uniref:Contractile injection system tape measure protein n=1 Tax=Chryseobacterium oryctis TaxID=2952618 RepID=A0ABT3HRM6_9FLAO|nr:contractile injection system tape measure protein [Chryseobacterium oryctis]MCW3162446.1 contractile injection system tape measure protein [Chryseobacterium oryctis]
MHLIRQHILDIDCSSETFGKELQNNLSAMLEKEFYPRLEKLLNQYSIEGYIWEIDSLPVEISEISPENWKEEIVRKSLEQIEYYLKLNQPQENASKIALNKTFNSEIYPVEVHAESLFLDFLKKGYIISNSFATDIETIISKLNGNEKLADEIVKTFKENLESLLRWIFSVPEDFKVKIYSFLPFQNEFQKISELKRQWEKRYSFSIFSNEIDEKQWYEMIKWMFVFIKTGFSAEITYRFLSVSTEKHWNIKKEEIFEFLQFITKEKTKDNTDITLKNDEMKFFENWKGYLQKELKIQKIIPDVAEENYSQIEEKIMSKFEDYNENNLLREEYIFYVENAGITILHPFLPMLFEQLGLTEKNEWRTTADIQKAVLLLHYLVYGNTEFQEDKMILNKIICGLSVNEVINIKINLSTEEKEACEDLLKAVLQHWKVMSSSSMDALRGTFLQRKGKLEIQLRGFEIWVEEKGYDILLEQIPWGITMVKTPWMEYHLTCNWNQ